MLSYKLALRRKAQEEISAGGAAVALSQPSRSSGRLLLIGRGCLKNGRSAQERRW
jgi:hypothetical protein